MVKRLEFQEYILIIHILLSIKAYKQNTKKFGNS